MKRHLIYSLAIVGASLALSPAFTPAADRIEFEPIGFGPPIYTRLETTGIYGFHDGGWTCIPIIRDPANIPADFNLLLVLDDDLDRARNVELQVQGFAITEGGPPKLQHYKDRDDFGVPILFVDTEELRNLEADQEGVIYFDDLFTLTHKCGVAEIYTEQVYTGWTHMIDAAGFLDDGTPFLASYVHGAGAVVPKVEAHIMFGN